MHCRWARNWLSRRDSHPRHAVCKTAVLAAELRDNGASDECCPRFLLVDREVNMLLFFGRKMVSDLRLARRLFRLRGAGDYLLPNRSKWSGGPVLPCGPRGHNAMLYC